ncbi:hypothetical protein PGT21_016404 [Puccinia graminis f. sp. tritici]|uniref:Uncharacterized protein n=2 Tax=Puccinia graminis f. sp. tritici TaxID=56615 RepID=E3L2A6_PUCGT|nr:uncharacterized protein PGTG_16719 [Puccinia graminis f. sp. tritici CRL 75-36-700-3]KAA1079617.1 hypothetical protein PGT21_017561 [Puccinia graminis f. sp. tritici]EFP90693.2 hypothetical protein PGTG_16719 [Puccinia graminis f. sp. tritici CRL 75-36-700-3]KAA1082844.1 hypothetical protein PGT21_016404 [Puccinia graminis f. sp. tritici]KAA1087945.1 hypothetical protein PGTUg99_005998 [Puccinia graminis f. sp. tritici]KAA1105176.1 hypothetical protein PGTUg99_005027 [Puccinia graminis f. s
MNSSMNCTVLFSILYMSSCAALPAGGFGGLGLFGSLGSEAPATGQADSKAGSDASTKSEKVKTASMVMETVSKGLAAGGLFLPSSITGAVGAGLKAGA